jgi:hypothetical protein
MPDFLPAKYAFSHEYALFLNDILVDIIKSGEVSELFATHIQFTSSAHAEAFEQAPDDKKWEWLDANGYGSANADVIYKQVILALLSDFCHFVFEALNSSKKGKITVAYALLRKPFKDNLFYLEWLLADPDDFIKAFTHGGPDELENRRKNDSQRCSLITKALSLTANPDMFDAQFIHDVRYDRKAGYGFAGTWDQANHLITTFSAIRTPVEGFNLVFANPQHEEHWKFLYTKLPSLLFYSVEVVEALLARIVPNPDDLFDHTIIRREIGFMLWTDSLQLEDLALDETSIELPECPQCGVAVILDKANMLLFYNEWRFRCQACLGEFDMDTDAEGIVE